MSKKSWTAKWLFSLVFLGLTAGLGGLRPTLAAAGEKANDAAAEKGIADKEDEQERIDRKNGKRGNYQKMFFGTFLLPSDSSQQTNADVVGTFVTDERDPHPGQTYLVKVDGGNQNIIEALKRYDTKQVQVMGKLRVNGKYLVASGVIETGPTPRVAERRSAGGL